MEMNGGGFGVKEKVSGWGGGGGDGNRGDLSGREGSQKLARTDSYPFRVNSASRSTENDPTFYNSSDFYDASESAGAGAGAGAAAKTVQLFPTAFKSPGMASLRLPFTSAQWQELEQQALIYKYMVADVPIPPDLVTPIRKSLGNAAPISTSSHSNHGWGSFNLRFSGNLDPEPGRCRRTDGKKWRCSRDVAPDQKYCERHMHRSRPRSRKPVEVQLQNNPSSSSSSSITTSSSTMCGLPSHLATKTFNPGDFCNKPSSTTDFKLPLQTLVPDKGCSRFLNWVEGGITDPMEANQQWKLLHSKLGATEQISSSRNNQQNDHQGCLFLNTNPGSLEPDSTYRQQQPPRVFIDAWSQVSGSSNNKSSESNKLPISSLTLSMSHREDIDAIHMGLGVVNNSDRDSLSGDKPPQALNWMIPVSWQSAALGGPLAEVLQSSTTAATDSSPPKFFSDKSWCGGNGGGLNLMRDGWGEPSPRDSPRLVSSPTGVLQKTLVSLSDSSSGSSPTVAAKSDIAIQWLNQHN